MLNKEAFKNKAWIALMLSLMTGKVHSVNYVIPPSPVQPYTLQSGPPPDTLTVNIGASLTTPGPVVTLLGGNTVTNNGTIQTTTNAPTIVAGPSSAGLMTINNDGPLNGFSFNSPAIDLTGVVSNGVQINTFVGSSIGGQILLPSNANSLINMAGGAVRGSLSKTAGLGTATLNINGSFGTSNIINQIDIINVSGPNTIFTIANNVSNFSTFTVNAGTQVVMTGNNTVLSGNVLNNNGFFEIDNGTVSATTINNGGTFTLFGGTFTGRMIGSANSTLNLQNNFSTSSTITNVNTINVLTGTFTINDTVSGYNALNNQSTINLEGGSLSGGITPLGSNSIINVNADFTTAGPMGARDINVNDESFFVVNHPLTATRALTIAPDASLSLNNSVTGSVTNSGTLLLDNTQIITGNYIQTSTASFTTTLGETAFAPFGNIAVGGNANIAGAIDVILPPDQGLQLSNNSTFDIVNITGPGSIYLNNPTLVQPSSTVLSFSLSTPTSKILRLTVNRMLYANVNTITAWNGVASALDQIRTQNPSPGQRNILNTLDSLGSVSQLQSALGQLAPIANGGVILTSLQMLNMNFDKIVSRLNGLQAKLDTFGSPIKGYIAGDFRPAPVVRGTYGPMFFANSLAVPLQNGVPGFTSITGGVGAIGDVPLNCYTKIGGAISYAAAGVKDDHNLGNHTNINNIQGSLYGRFEYGWPFLDGMISLGHNRYNSKRNIAVINQTATGNYSGTQRSAKIRGGIAVPIKTLEITPIGSVQYTKLKIHPYLEQGTNGANLRYPSTTVNATEYAFGVRLAEISEPETFLPEVHFMALQYVKNPNLQVTSRFTDGGPSFITAGPPLAKNGYNVGGSVSALLSNNLILIGSYDYETRKKYSGHSLYLKIRRYF